jgi:hypothetical protein
MSIKLMSLIWEDHTKQLTNPEKSVMTRLADFASDSGESIFPSLNRLADDLSLSRRGVIKIIDSLIEKGYISKLNRTKENGSNKSNLYTINVEKLESNVDKSVDKMCMNKRGSEPRSPGGSEPCSPGMVNHVHPIHHIKPSLKKHHIDEDAFCENEFLKEEIIKKLTLWGVVKGDIVNWIRKYGLDILNYQISLVEEGGKSIRSKGASLRGALNRLEGPKLTVVGAI